MHTVFGLHSKANLSVFSMCQKKKKKSITIQIRLRFIRCNYCGAVFIGFKLLMEQFHGYQTGPCVSGITVIGPIVITAASAQINTEASTIVYFSPYFKGNHIIKG